MKIPPLVFARYDVGTLLKMIENSKSKKIMHVQEKENDLKLDIKNKQQIACLTIFKNKERIHIAYRMYKGKFYFKMKLLNIRFISKIFTICWIHLSFNIQNFLQLVFHCQELLMQERLHQLI